LKWLGVKDEFVKQTGLVFIGMGLFNLFNLLYHLFMIRTLPPTDYGDLNTLVALFTVISVPAGTVQTTVTRFFSSFNAQNDYHRATELIWHFLLLMSVIALSLFLLTVLGGSFVSSFLQISSRGLVILFGATLVFAMIIPVPWGGLQGLQKFGLLTLNLIINSGLKLASGVLFVLLGLGLWGAMSAITVSYVITTILALFLIRVILFKKRAATGQGVIGKSSFPSNFSGVYYYSFSAGLVLLCFMVLTNMDLILVKHFFAPIEAGYYSIAQMVGKIILVLPIPIVTVMFPKLSSLGGEGKGIPSTLGKSLRIAVVLCGGSILFSLLFPLPIVKVLSGKAYLECVPLIGMFSVNMTLFSLTFILLYYHLSTPRRAFLYPLVFFTLIQTGLIILFHDTLMQVLMIAGSAAFFLFMINFYLAYHPRIKRKKYRDLPG
jgi:O-antigen/teichoic acid export membrane protein